MKYFVVLFSLSLLSFSVYTHWETWYCEEGGFIVSVPHTFIEKSQKLDAEWGEIDMKHYYLDDRAQYSTNLFYMISYSDYPSDILHADSLELLDEFFQVTIDHSAKAVGGEVIYSQKDYEGINPNVMWRINYERGKYAIRSKAILSNSRLYILKVFYDAQGGKLDDVNRFFDSFQLKNTLD